MIRYALAFLAILLTGLPGALKAEPAPDTPEAAPGTLLDDRLTIACADGAVRLTLVQRPGKAPVDGAAFLRGFALPAGTLLGDAACSAGN